MLASLWKTEFPLLKFVGFDCFSCMFFFVITIFLLGVAGYAGGGHVAAATPSD